MDDSIGLDRVSGGEQKRQQERTTTGGTMNRRDILKLGLGAPALAMLPRGRAFAQERFPSRPIRIVVPFPAGANHDVLGRMTAQKLGTLFDQPVIVENKPGAEGAIAAVDVARASPDGHSILLGSSSTHFITPALMDKPTYDPLKAFAQISLFAIQPQCIAVNNEFPARTLSEFIAVVQQNPGKFSYGAVTSSLRLGVELLRQQAGSLDIVTIPYKGSPQALQDLIANRIQIYPSHPGTIANHHKEGRLRILAVYSAQRIKTLPDVPTAVESGLPNLIHSTFNVYCTTAGTPRPIVDQLHKAINATVSDRLFVETLEREGIIPVTDSTPESATAFVQDAVTRLTPLLKAMKTS